MFPCGLSLHLKHPFCTPSAWDSASSWKEFKQRQPIIQHRGGRDLAAGRCVGVITAAINIPRTCKEPEAVAGGTGGAGRSHLMLDFSVRAKLSRSPATKTSCRGLLVQFNNGQWSGLAFISLCVRTCVSTLVWANVISKAERGTYPGKSGALVNEGFLFVVWMNLAMGQVAVLDLCVSSLGAAPCAWLEGRMWHGKPHLPQLLSSLPEPPELCLWPCFTVKLFPSFPWWQPRRTWTWLPKCT